MLSSPLLKKCLSMNIYIANFNSALTDNDLIALFTPYGQVQSAAIAIDGFTYQSRGFGDVGMYQSTTKYASTAFCHNNY
jgi:RNA recognition motif-containing protein